MKKTFLAATGLLWLMTTQTAHAFPWFAAESAESRASSGRIVCANCHLAEKEVEVEMPQSVAPGQKFEVKVHIPYDVKALEVVGAPNEKGEYRGLIQAGAYVQLPEGFKAIKADDPTLTAEEKKKFEEGEWSEGIVLNTLSENPKREIKESTFVVGPIGAEDMGKHENSITIPVLAPDPNTQKNVYFGNYGVYIGGNHGRGQVYLNGASSNNAEYTSPAAGTITKITPGPVTIGENTFDTGNTVTIKTDKGTKDIAIPPGPDLLVKVGDMVKSGQPLTSNPNVGGFGHLEKDIVLQDPQRILWLIVALVVAFAGQLMLVVKKKQIEKIQEYEAHQQGLL